MAKQWSSWMAIHMLLIIILIAFQINTANNLNKNKQLVPGRRLFLLNIFFQGAFPISHFRKAH